jgi:hypothetical protein
MAAEVLRRNLLIATSSPGITLTDCRQVTPAPLPPVVSRRGALLASVLLPQMCSGSSCTPAAQASPLLLQQQPHQQPQSLAVVQHSACLADVRADYDRYVWQHCCLAGSPDTSSIQILCTAHKAQSPCPLSAVCLPASPAPPLPPPLSAFQGMLPHTMTWMEGQHLKPLASLSLGSGCCSRYVGHSRRYVGHQHAVLASKVAVTSNQYLCMY